MKNDKTKFLLCLLFFAVLAAITFRCTWPADHVFNASDLNIGRLAAKKHFLPESLTGYFTANQVMGASGANLTLFNVVLACMPLTLFANTFYALVLIGGSMSMVWFLRIWNRGWLSSVFGALIAFWVNSILLAAGGHAYKMEVLALLVLSLGLVEKAVREKTSRRAIGFSLLAGLSVGVMMIEQQDVAFLAGLLLGIYTIFRLIQEHRTIFTRWFSILIPLGVIALLLAGQTLAGSYRHNIAGAAAVQGGGDDKWNYITQWSMVPSEWPDLIALGWSGWSSGNPEGPYWGIRGQSAEWPETGQGFRNFKLTANYFGIIPFLIAIYGFLKAVRNRKTGESATLLFWSLAGLIALWLSFGKYSLLYKFVYHLPLLGNIRDQSKFLDLFQICLAVVSAYGLDTLLDRSKDDLEKVWAKRFWIICSAVSGLMLISGLGCLLFPADRIANFNSMGFESFAQIMVKNMAKGWFHAGGLALACSALAWVAWKKAVKARWIAVAFVVVLSLDSLVLTSHYFKADDIAPLKKGNVVVNFLKDNQGNERTFFMDQSGIYNQWLASDGPYHGLNLFNIWQMPRMPVEYKNFLGTVGRNQIRMWQLSAVKYIAAPAAIMQQLQQNPELGKQFKLVLNYQVPTAQGMRQDVLLDFKGSLPRFSIYKNWEVLPVKKHCERLIAPDHNPLKTVLVADSPGMTAHSGSLPAQITDTKVTKRNAVVHVESDEPAILRFSQRYQPKWKVYVDGKQAELLRLDYLSMGVLVPAGSSEIEFQCVRNGEKAVYMSAVLLLAIAGSTFLFLKPIDAEK